MQPAQTIQSKEDFTLLFERFWEELYDFAMIKVQRSDIAQDLVQELFAQLWIKRKKIKVHGKWRLYLFTALRNRITDHFRSNKNQTLPLSEEDWMTSEDTNLPESRLTLRFIQQQLRELTPAQQTVFKLYRLQGFSVREISDQLALSENTVKSHIQESTRRIRLLAHS